jgi:hypothetical protein
VPLAGRGVAGALMPVWATLGKGIGSETLGLLLAMQCSLPSPAMKTG